MTCPPSSRRCSRRPTTAPTPPETHQGRVDHLVDPALAVGNGGCRSARFASLAPVGQLVGGLARLLAGLLRGQLGELALDLAPDAADRDAEDTLATAEQVDDLVAGGALVDARAVAHQRHAGQVVGAAGTQVL